MFLASKNSVTDKRMKKRNLATPGHGGVVSAAGSSPPESNYESEGGGRFKE